MLAIIDNYDSFVHNLARYFRRLGVSTCVIRNDQASSARLRELAPQAIVISPGPGTPVEAGHCLDVVRAFTDVVPILGVCLGHQAIGAAWGASVVRAAQPCHGRATWVRHTQQRLFAGLPQPLQVGRYHSLVIDPPSVPAGWEVSAWTDDGLIMALEHRDWPVFGVQFHPESVLTQCGLHLLANFLRLAGIGVVKAPPDEEIPARNASVPDTAWPTLPITF